MASDLTALCFAAQEPARLAQYWAGVLGWSLADSSDTDSVLLAPDADAGFALRFTRTAAPKVGRNLMHLELTSSTAEQQAGTVARSLRLGGRHEDVGQLPGEEHVVLADPEGNEYCVIEPGNSFLEGCGFLGAVSCDGTHAVGAFWSQALGWPLVWDEGEETAIQAPRGGPKISWGGPPLMSRENAWRVHYELVTDDVERECERLVALGAELRESDGAARLADPDGNVFRVLPMRTLAVT